MSSKNNTEVIIDGKMVGKLKHKPQILKSKPFIFETPLKGKEILIAAVDKQGQRTEAKVV